MSHLERLRRPRSIAVLALASALVAAPAAALAKGGSGSTAGSTKLTKIVVIGDWLPWAATGGEWAAVKYGYYKAAGLDVQIKAPANPTDPVKLVSTNNAQFGMAYVPEVIQARAKNIPIVSVGAKFRDLTNGLFSNPAANIRTPCDLKGKTIGVNQKADDIAITTTMLASCHLTWKDVKEVDPGYAVNKLVDTKRIDAGWGLTLYEGALYKVQHGSYPNWLLGRKWGVPNFYWMVVIGNPGWMQAHAAETKAFLAATVKGIEAFRKHPDAITSYLASLNPSVDKKAQAAMAGVANPLWADGYTAKHGLLSQQASVWSAAQAWMKKYGMIKKTLPTSSYFTNAYLPGG